MIALASALLLGAVQSGTAPSVHLTVGPGPCRPKVDGKFVALADLSAQARGWRNREVHFQPDQRTSYSCVDAVLRVLREADVTRLGFVGNEVYRSDESAPK